MPQPTARAINAHLASMTSYYYVRVFDGQYYSHKRISRAKMVKGQMFGRAVSTTGKAWIPISANAQIELS